MNPASSVAEVIPMSSRQSPSPQLEDGYTRIANELIEAIACAGFTANQHAVLWAILRKTYGYNKKSDDISLSQIAEMTGVDRSNVRRALISLSAQQVIIRSNGVHSNKISLNKNYAQWGGGKTTPGGVKVTPVDSGVKVTPSVGSKQPQDVGLNQPPQKTTNQKTIPKEKNLLRNRNCASASFDKFWAIWPNKKDRKRSLAAFVKINPDDALLQTILAAVAAGMTITRSGVMRTAPLAMRLRANSTWAMLEFVFNGMVFLLLGLQLPDILSTSLVAAEADPNVETWMLFTDIILIYAALMLVRFGWLWTMRKLSQRFLKKKPMEFGSWTTRELLISSVAGVRGAITLAGVLSIPLLLPDGNVFPARYELVFLAAGVILFSLFVGVVMLPILLQHIEVADHSQQLKEERIARAATAEVAIVAIQKMEERLAADTEENIDNQLLTEVSSRVIGNLRRRADGRNDVESSILEENLERRFRLAALRSERAELYHLRATREISNETLQKLLHDLDLLEALLIEENQ